jgi:hypothetical protein
MFKIGEIIVCVNDCKTLRHGVMTNCGLTLYKQYESIRYNGKPWDQDKWVHIINDRNESQNYHTENFVTLLEYRKMKINKICAR